MPNEGMPTEVRDVERATCPFACPYNPDRETRPVYSEDITVEEIPDKIEQTPKPTKSKSEINEIMPLILRETDHVAEIHFKQVWETDYETKVGVTSKKQYAHIFSEKIDWERAHQRWSSERVDDTDMWEVDLDQAFYVAAMFADEGVEVTFADEVWKELLKS